MELPRAVNARRINNVARQARIHILLHEEEHCRCGDARQNQRPEGVGQLHRVHQVQKAERRNLCGHRHDEQNDGKGQLAQLEVIRIDGVGRQCAEIDRQRRTGSRHDQAVAQTCQDRYIGIMGGVKEVDAKAAAGQRVKPLLDGKVVVRGVDDQHIEEEQADKAEDKQHDIGHCTLQCQHRVVNFACLCGSGGCSFGFVRHTVHAPSLVMLSGRFGCLDAGFLSLALLTGQAVILLREGKVDDDAKHRAEQEHQHRNSTGCAVVFAVQMLVQVHDNGVGRAVRVALAVGQNLRHIKHLQAADEAGDQRVDEQRADQRDRDAPEHCGRGCTVQLGGLIQAGVHTHDGSHQNDGRIAEPHQEVHQPNQTARCPDIGKPAHRLGHDAELEQDRVDRPCLRV